ncbi:coproporphyrinogen oxidase [Marinoscillum furvescens DSM 4134]|uniref:coproporphyrinogen oxidase n=2 Tax=Marinoscillum furvescens TaxID=1026 RepID=A0A3D9L1B8_MARFU|nr:coproporphyrinogen oxidase [Marinoscillum furvescens DSM 4134]
MKSLQGSICNSLISLDGKSSFREDQWERAGGGGGRSRVITNGDLIEKGGVNFSAVHGDLPEKIQQALKMGKSTFYATGVSIVLHPQNPWVPIIHMNVRYFETKAKNSDEGTYWFGGGIDLTPHYVDPADGGYLHQQLKMVCDQTDSSYYPRFKKWADDYFYIRHRKETRGVGGIFYDQLNEQKEKKSFDELWQFHQSVGERFVPIYEHFANKYRSKPYTDEHKNWQMVRRGRYVEFNLVWDKGTKFGLDTDGRTESILMSMPPQAQWHYDHQPAAGSAEAETLKWLQKDINWIAHA